MRTDAVYRERLLPRWWAWLLAAGLATMLSVAYGAALGGVAGWLVAAGTGALIVVLLLATAPRVEVHATCLAVDDAQLPLDSIGSVEVVSADRIRELRGPGGDARLFVALRPWSAADGVLVVLADDDDPHPAWLFSSRHPARLAQALTATMGR